MTDIVRQTLSHPPVDTRYVAGLWHPSRISLDGIVTEARVFAASFMKARNPEVRKFLILGRARSGSTLLTQLPGAHPDITCEREVLGRRVLRPRLYLNRLAHKAKTRAYGAKLLSYQMVQVQRFRDPAGFLGPLARDGFRFIHIERDTFAQTLSLYMAQASRGVADRACDWIGVPPAPGPVAGGMKKILPSDPRKVIANYAALADGLHKAGLSHMLPD